MQTFTFNVLLIIFWHFEGDKAKFSGHLLVKCLITIEVVLRVYDPNIKVSILRTCVLKNLTDDGLGPIGDNSPLRQVEIVWEVRRIFECP